MAALRDKDEEVTYLYGWWRLSSPFWCVLEVPIEITILYQERFNRPTEGHARTIEPAKEMVVATLMALDDIAAQQRGEEVVTIRLPELPAYDRPTRDFDCCKASWVSGPELDGTDGPACHLEIADHLPIFRKTAVRILGAIFGTLALLFIAGKAFGLGDMEKADAIATVPLGSVIVALPFAILLLRFIAILELTPRETAQAIGNALPGSSRFWTILSITLVVLYFILALARC